MNMGQLKKRRCAIAMGQRSNNVAVKDAKVELKMEEYAGDMGQGVSNNVVVKDAKT